MSFAILTRGKIAAMILALALPMLLCILSCNLGGKPAVVMPPAADVQPDTAPSDTAPSDKGTAVAAKIENRSMLLRGIWAEGIMNDFVLENDLIRAVITAPDHKLAEMDGGQLVDVALKSFTMDYIRGITTTVKGENIPSYSYNRAEAVNSGYPDNAAAVVLTGTGGESYSIRTEYILRPDETYIEIVTTLTNLTQTDMTGVSVGDTADWGSCVNFIGNYGVLKPNDTQDLENLDWFCGFMDNFSAGLTIEKGAIKGRFYQTKSEAVYLETSLAPGASVTCSRFLVIADKKLSTISDFAFKKRVSDFGFITGTVIQPDTNEPIPNVDVQFIISRRNDTIVPAKPYTRTYSDSKGQFEVIVPEGQYFVRTQPFARKAARKPLSFFVPAGDSYVLQLQVSSTSKLKFTCTDTSTSQFTPCKLTFIHIPPTDFIDQGPGTGLTARNIHYSATGNETIDLPTGRYKIVFSRGPEYDNYEEEILITYTGNNEINARLNRVVDTAGYITADIGVRTNNSQDCYVTPEDRLVTAAAEGVEYIVSGDSNIAFNLAPALEKTGLAPFIRTGIGKRFEFAGPDSPGTFLIWPFSEAEAAREGVSLDTKNAPGFFKSIRAQYPDSLIQVCRPGFPLEGYFTRFGYDHKEKHTITDPEFSYEFDLLEFWEGKRFGASEETLKMMMNVWLAGYDRIRPTGGSFSHETWGEEVGYPRLYIATENDDPAKVTDKDIVAGIRKGNYQISNGPFIKFTVNGMPPGSIVTDTDGTIDCHLEVFAPPWVHTSYIEVKMDGIFLKRTIQPPSTAVKRFPGETSIEGADNFRLKIKKDSIITVEVVGRSPLNMHPVVSAYPAGQPPLSLAVTTPIFIDFDGNGKYDPPSRDQIGM